MEITTESFRNFLKINRNKLIFFYWILMFLVGIIIVLKLLGRL